MPFEFNFEKPQLNFENKVEIVTTKSQSSDQNNEAKDEVQDTGQKGNNAEDQ